MTPPAASPSPPESDSAHELEAPWGPLSLREGQVTPLRVGPRALWFQARDGEIWIAHEDAVSPEEARSGGPWTESPGPEPPEGIEWFRWATPGGEINLFLRPAFPDRTLVLEPEHSFRLLTRAEARVYVRVPLWIQVELPMAPPGSALLLEEMPSLAMSDTWWGGFMDGELAYWLPTTARREMVQALHHPHLAVCPLLLSNRSGSDLAVEKLALRAPHLSIFSHDGGLWADEARVTYQGLDEGSQIEVTGRAPVEAEGAVRVTPPRTPSQRSFRARTFDRIRGLPGVMGG